jgi:hypothetical protein
MKMLSILIPFLAGCTLGLGDQVSLRFVEIEAKRKKEHCYVSKHGENFCIRHLPQGGK